MIRHAPDVCLLSNGTKFESLSVALHNSIRFFWHPFLLCIVFFLRLTYLWKEHKRVSQFHCLNYCDAFRLHLQAGGASSIRLSAYRNRQPTPSNRFGNGVSVTFTISSITTLTMVHICQPCASIPSGWVDVTSTYPHCPTASHLSSFTRHFMVEISRMEVIAHARTSSNDRRSHRYDICTSISYVRMNFLSSP